MSESSADRRVLWHLLAATRGGPTRVHILALLRDRPRNTNELAVELKLDYKTIEYHLRVLRENRVIATPKEGYGAQYALTPDMWTSFDEFERAARDTPRRSRDTTTEGAL